VRARLHDGGLGALSTFDVRCSDEQPVINEVRGGELGVYDISSKPPANDRVGVKDKMPERRRAGRP